MLITHTLAMGGTDRVAVHLANALITQGPTLLFHAARAREDAGLVDMLDAAVERVSADGTSKSRNYNLNTALPLAIRTVRRFRPALVMGTGNNNALFASLVHLFNPHPQRRLAIKVTSPILRGRDKRFKRWFRTRLYGWIFTRSHVILALSEREGAQIAAMFPAHAAKIAVACNPYVTNAMLAVPPMCATAAPTRFLAVGRLHKQKNIPALLAAWREADLLGATLTIAGDGPLMARMRDLANELGIEGSTVFTGYCKDVTPLLRDADCLVLSSDYEGLPAVVLEALAAGRPVIATDCFPAARELLGDAPGCCLVPVGDVAALADAMRAHAACDRSVDPRVDAALRARAAPYRLDAAARSHVEKTGLAPI